MDSDELFELADNLAIASDRYKWMAELVRGKMLHGKRRVRAGQLARRADRLIADIVRFAVANDDLPGWDAGNQRLADPGPGEA